MISPIALLVAVFAAPAGAADCGTLSSARLIVRHASAGAGEQEVLFAGRVRVAAGDPADVESGAEVTFTEPGSAGAALEVRSGRTMLSRRSGVLHSVIARGVDAGVAEGGIPPRTVLRLADRRPRRNEIRVGLHGIGTTMPVPEGALLAVVSLNRPDGTPAACGQAVFEPQDCTFDPGRDVLRCRAARVDPAETPAPTPTPTPQSSCVVTGCSGQLCADHEVPTSCEWFPYYACYRDASCERQSDGECGWSPTEELSRCLLETGGVNPAERTPGPLEKAVPHEWFDCSADVECSLISGLDCCGCDFGGGPEAAIRSGRESDLAQLRSSLCADELCPGIDVCRSSGVRAVCLNGSCVAVSGP